MKISTILSILPLILSVRGLPQQQCTTIYSCRVFALTATRRADLGLNVDAILSLDPQISTIASLDGRPFSFTIPPFLNISSGNSGGQFATSTLSFVLSTGNPSSQDEGTIASSPIVTCTYTGIGVSSPWFPDEIAAANAYKFSSCSPSTSLSVDSVITVIETFLHELLLIF